MLRIVDAASHDPAPLVEVGVIAPLPDSVREHLTRTGRLPTEFSSSGRQVRTLLSSSGGTIEIDEIEPGEPMQLDCADYVISQVVLTGKVLQLDKHTLLLWPSERDLRQGGALHVAPGAARRLGHETHASRQVGRVSFSDGLKCTVSICGAGPTVYEVMIDYDADVEAQPRHRSVEESLSVCVITTPTGLPQTLVETNRVVSGEPLSGGARWEHGRTAFVLKGPVFESELQLIIVFFGVESRRLALERATSQGSDGE